MKIWVDADACPGVIKDILFRVAERRALQVTLVANQLLRVPGSRFVSALQVPAGADVADAEIVRRMAPGDLVITGDIPLAALVLDKQGFALNPRGEFYTQENIAQQLVGYQRDLQRASFRHPEQDLLDDTGTGIRIHPNLHSCSLASALRSRL